MSDKPILQDLEQFLMDERLARIDGVVARRCKSLAVVAEDLEDPHNVSAVLRTCESFGVQELHCVSKRFEYQGNPKVTQGAEKWMDIETHRETGECFASLKARGFLVCVTDFSPDSKSLLQLPTDRPLALVFGNEVEGITEEARRLADVRFVIPMQGFSQSLNVSVAVAVCVSHLIFERIQRVGTSGDLDEAERAALKARYCGLAIKQRGRLFDEKTLQNLKRPRSSKRPRRDE